MVNRASENISVGSQGRFMGEVEFVLDLEELAVFG